MPPTDGWKKGNGDALYYFYRGAGVYTVTLRVIDEGGAESTDTMTITVFGGNYPPAADAGGDQTVTVQTTVQLDGSRSSDQDGDDLSCLWAFLTRFAYSATGNGKSGL